MNGPRRFSTLKVGVSGVRGVVGESLTPQLAATFAQACGSYLGGGRILVGRDTRPSGPMLEHAVAAGLLSVGCQPAHTGVCPTPSLQVLVAERKAAGGIMISASHNPVQWNAMKFIGPRGLFLDEHQARELLDLYHQADFRLAAETDLKTAADEPDATKPHFDRVRSYLDVDAIRAARFRVAVDCVNGVGAVFSRPFLESLGCEAISICDVPDGRFARNAEPLPEHLGALGEAVRKHSCALGFAQDPDGDRLALVDETGAPIGEDYTLVLAVKHALQRKRGPVVINIATSRAVDDVAAAAGCEVIRTKVGEINVTQQMLSCGAAVGGEGSGGVILPEVHPCRDGFMAMGLTLELMARDRRPLSRIVADLPRYHIVKDKVLCSADQAPAALRTLREHYASQRISRLDGLRVDFTRSWLLVRPSNTEPIIRFTAEAPGVDEAQALIAEAKRIVERKT